MPRPEKVQAVADIKERLEAARAVFVAEYSGLSVQEQQELRRGLREAESEFKVVKMTLARLAASDLGHDELADMLTGPTGLTFAAADAATTAKVLRDFAKDHERLVIKGALLGSDMLTPERIEALADLEPRDVLLAKIAGAFKAPMSKMAGLLAAMPRDMATMIMQLIEKAPADEAPAEESAASEAEVESAPADADEAPADEAPTEEATTEDAAEASDDAGAEGDSEADDTATEDDEEPAEKAEEE